MTSLGQAEPSRHDVGAYRPRGKAGQPYPQTSPPTVYQFKSFISLLFGHTPQSRRLPRADPTRANPSMAGEPGQTSPVQTRPSLCRPRWTLKRKLAHLPYTDRARGTGKPNIKWKLTYIYIYIYFTFTLHLFYIYFTL